MNEENLAKLHALLDEVLRVNLQFNLTSIRDPQEAWIKHILDSLEGLQSGCFDASERVVDVGAGAGFPGLALAAARPNLKVRLLDSTRKKCDFINAAAAKLELNAKALCGRAEIEGQSVVWRERFDVATARAVGSFNEVCELAMPLIKVGGKLVLWRGQHAREEVRLARGAIRVLGGDAVSIYPYNLPGYALQYHIVVVEKSGETPKIYPRRDGVPKQNPL